MSKLYLEHFGLDRPPFRLTPDLDFFYAGSRRGDVLDGLLHVASHEEGIVTVVAEVGSGKTLLARLLLTRLPEDIDTVFLANPCFSREEILSAIARDLGMEDTPASIEGKLAQLNAELLRRHNNGRRVLLVVDEAHAMPAESLEEIRLLSNLETSEHKLVNILLLGQPELDLLLSENRLRQVRDRIVHRFELPPLPESEILTYVDHRLRTAGWKRGSLFSRAAQNILVRQCSGRLRRINQLADKALLAAFADNSDTVEKKHVQTALADLQPDPVPTRPTRKQASAQGQPGRLFLAITTTMLAVAAGTGLGWWLHQTEFEQIAVRSPVPPETTLASTPAPPSPETPPAQPAPLPEPAASPAEPSRAEEKEEKDLPTTGATSNKGVLEAPTTQSEPATPPKSEESQAAPPTPKANSRSLEKLLKNTQDRFALNPPEGYTVQLASLPIGGDTSFYLKNLAQYVDLSHVLIQTSIYSGKRYWVVFYGEYRTEIQAQEALASLPSALKAKRPMLRTWKKIRQEIEL